MSLFAPPQKLVHRLLLGGKSSLHSSKVARKTAAMILLMQARKHGSANAVEVVEKIRIFCNALRLIDERAFNQVVEAEMLSLRDSAGLTRAEWTEALVPRSSSRPCLLQKAIILKPWVSAEEPGVIFISFEHQWAQLLRLPDFERLAEDYTLVVSPTWSPPHSPLNVVFPFLWPKPVHCLISNEDDLNTLPRLSSNYRMIPLLASNWVNENVFEPQAKSERDLDLVMVANFASFKRHVRFFQALRQMPRDLKVMLIGQKEGDREEKSVLREAAAFGVADRFEMRISMPHAEVLQTLCRAKVSTVLSLREGSCVVVAESLFANTPVGLMQGAHIGSARFINDETGVFLRENYLAEDLTTLIKNSAQLNPREWALNHGIGARRSSEILNEHIKTHSLTQGKKWTRNLARMQWCPNPRRLDVEDDTWADIEHVQITNRFGVMIGARPINPDN